MPRVTPIRTWLVAAAQLTPMAAARQGTGTLHVTITLADSAGRPTPVARHTLLISDNPATTVPRVVRTGADGTVKVTLGPGTYPEKSERAVTFGSQALEWFQMIDVAAGRTVTLPLSLAHERRTGRARGRGVGPAVH